MKDVERLLDSTFPFVKGLLETYGEFYPVAAAIKTNNSIAQIGTYDGDDHPLSDKVISDLKKGLKAKQAQFKSITIFYDVRVIDPNTRQKTDAVAVYVENKNEKNTAYVFYYPYVLNDNNLVFAESWKEEIDKEIFDN